MTIPAYASNDIYSGMILWMTLDSSDISGTTVTDNSGNSNTGTTQNSPSAVIGELAQALSFTAASSQYISAQTTPQPGTGPYTLSAWVKTSATETGAIISKRIVSGTFSQIDLAVGDLASSCSFATGNKVVFTLVDSSTNVYCNVTTNSYAGDGQWHLYQGVWNGGNSVLIYVDGVSVAVTNNSTIGTIGTVTNTMPWEIGYDQTNFMNGSIDDARVYSRAISASESKAMYYQGIGRHKKSSI